MTFDELLRCLDELSGEELQAVRDKLDEIEKRLEQAASGEGAVIPGDQFLLRQQSQAQQ